MAAMTAGFVRTEPGGSMAQHAAARTDYELLLGTWQFTRRVVNGKPVPASVLRNTILITDHNTFRLPKASGVGTHPAGSFTVNPGTRPRQVDSIAAGGHTQANNARNIRDSRSQPLARLLEIARWLAANRVQVSSRKRPDSSVLEKTWAGAVPLNTARANQA
jgi:hypothetical protein